MEPRRWKRDAGRATTTHGTSMASTLGAGGGPFEIVTRRDRVRDVNYFCRWRQLFLPAKGEQRSVAHHLAHSVVVVGRSVAGEDVSAGAPAGAEAPAEAPGTQERESPDPSDSARFMELGLPSEGAWLCRGVWRARSGSWRHQIPTGPNDAPSDRSPRRSPSDRGRSDPSARRSDCS